MNARTIKGTNVNVAITHIMTTLMIIGMDSDPKKTKQMTKQKPSRRSHEVNATLWMQSIAIMTDEQYGNYFANLIIEDSKKKVSRS